MHSAVAATAHVYPLCSAQSVNDTLTSRGHRRRGAALRDGVAKLIFGVVKHVKVGFVCAESNRGSYVLFLPFFLLYVTHAFNGAFAIIHCVCFMCPYAFNGAFAPMHCLFEKNAARIPLSREWRPACTRPSIAAANACIFVKKRPGAPLSQMSQAWEEWDAPHVRTGIFHSCCSL